MSLRRRLIYLLAGFAVLAITTTFATVYGVKLHVEDASESFHRTVAATAEIDRLRIAARARLVSMYEVLDGRRKAGEAYRADRDEFLTRLNQIASFAPLTKGADAEALTALRDAWREAEDRFLGHCTAGERAEARSLLDERIEADLLAALETRLRGLRSEVEQNRNRSLDTLVTSNSQILLLATIVGLAGAALVAVGAALIRRWLIIPLGVLQESTVRFSRGDLRHRVRLATDDELGELGAALNEMAESLVNTHAELQTSETKYRSLFENQRDAAMICDSHGRVVEHRDGDTGLLAHPAGDPVGQEFLNVWPWLVEAELDWATLVRGVCRDGRQVRVSEVEAPGADAEQDSGVVLDVVAYPIEYGMGRCVAIVLRDVTERVRLQKEARRAETMATIVTFARGVAHDFSNLLTSATATLSRLQKEAHEPRLAERAGTALRACTQAASLSRKLFGFATGDPGDPEVIPLGSAVRLILDSFDEALLDGIDVDMRFDDQALVRMDRDHLTQIVLNLAHNALEAMNGSGHLRIGIDTQHVDADHRSPLTGDVVVLAFTDSGCGMDAAVQARIFEPLFTTKQDGTDRKRGMGLAAVYMAVRNAEGRVEVDSQFGRGTTIRVLLPAIDDPANRKGRNMHAMDQRRGDFSARM